MASSLPDNPSLRQLRDAAEVLMREGLTVDEAQSAVARRHGFSGWAALERYLEIARELSVDPAQVDEDALADADRFCALAALRYTETDAPPRWDAAAQILSAQPGLVESHVWAAAAAADPEALTRRLAKGDGANSAGGPFRWVPLMYLCYSRVHTHVQQDRVLAAATVLLDAGADPNAGYLWRGMAPPFTALTGVFGEGEQGPRRQPRHPHAPQLATLLLERGAHPVDQQTLYNRMFRADDSHLELLFAHGLAEAGPGPWELLLGEAMETREQVWQRQIEWAAGHGFGERLDLLARNGVDIHGAQPLSRQLPENPNAYDDDGATALHHAAWDGDLALIRRLLDAGADPSIVDRRFGTTAHGWAVHAYQTEAADFLESVVRRDPD